MEIIRADIWVYRVSDTGSAWVIRGASIPSAVTGRWLHTYGCGRGIKVRIGHGIALGRGLVSLRRADVVGWGCGARAERDRCGGVPALGLGYEAALPQQVCCRHMVKE